MTNTENTSAADRPAGKKASAASETTTVPVSPQPTTVVETRRGVSGGILIGAIGAALAGGLLLGGGTGALLTHIYESGGHSQVRPGQLSGMPGQGDGQQGGGQQGGPQGGFPGGPPQGPNQNGPDQQDGQDDSGSSDTDDSDNTDEGTETDAG